jgi:hypothetical protein
MKLKGSKLVLIGSHTADLLIKEDVLEILIFDKGHWKQTDL